LGSLHTGFAAYFDRFCKIASKKADVFGG